jgi:hypothetical protein
MRFRFFVNENFEGATLSQKTHPTNIPSMQWRVLHKGDVHCLKL